MEIGINRPPDPGPDRRRWLAPAIAGVLVLAAIAWDASRRGGADRPISWPGPSAGPSAPAGVAAIPSEAAESAELDAQDFEKVLDDFLGQPSTTPMAQEFRREFMAQPPLRGLFDRYRQDQRARPSPQNFERFAHAVVSRAEFRQLLSRFMQDPGFRQSALRFAQLPLVRPVVGAASARLAGAGRAEPRANAFLGVSRTGGAIPGGASSHFGTAGGATAAGGGDGSLSAVTYVSSAAAGEQDGYGVTAALKSSADAGKGVDSRNPLASLCFQANAPITPQQCKAISDNLAGTDIWGACYKSGNYDTCKQLCSQGVIPCSNVPSYYDACMSATGDTTGCAQACQGRSDCTVPQTQPTGTQGSSCAPNDSGCQNCQSDPTSGVTCSYVRGRPSHCCCYDTKGNIVGSSYGPC